MGDTHALIVPKKICTSMGAVIILFSLLHSIGRHVKRGRSGVTENNQMKVMDNVLTSLLQPSTVVYQQLNCILRYEFVNMVLGAAVPHRDMYNSTFKVAKSLWS